MLQTKNCIVSKKPHQPIQPKPHWFGSDFIFKVYRTKPIHILFYLAVRMTFILKTEPNHTANTPSSSLPLLQNSSSNNFLFDLNDDYIIGE